jgi:hypothetical protein
MGGNTYDIHLLSVCECESVCVPLSVSVSVFLVVESAPT